MMQAHEAASPYQNVALPRIAAGSSFYTAMRILPKERRNAVMAIYAFCRAVDDIADDWTAPRAPLGSSRSGTAPHNELAETGGEASTDAEDADSSLLSTTKPESPKLRNRAAASMLA